MSGIAGMTRSVLALGGLAIVLAGCGSHAAAGSLDASFGKGGKVLTSFGGSSGAGARGVALQQDGKIVVAGSTGGSNSVFAVARYDANGTLDTSFGKGGKVITGFGSGWDYASAVTIQPDGKIVVAGTVYPGREKASDVAVARYTTTGALDTTFGTGGKALAQYGSRSSDASAVALAPDGKIVVAGTTGRIDSRFALARFTADGTLDTSFGMDGTVLTGFGSFVSGVAVQPDGKVVVVGLGGTGNDNAFVHPPPAFTDSSDAFAMARYTTDGTPDMSFGKAGKVLTLFGLRTSSAKAVAIEPDGKIVVAGSVGNGFGIARYTAGGIPDARFGTNGRVVAPFGGGDVAAIATQDDGKIVVAGANTGSPGGGFAVARYTTNGRLDPSLGTGGKVHTGAWPATIEIQPDGKIILAGGSAVGFELARYVP